MTSAQIENRLLGNIMAVADGMTVGKRKAEAIVGGRRTLERLHLSGKVRCTGKVNAQNGKWRYNLRDVLMHCKDSLGRSHKSENF